MKLYIVEHYTILRMCDTVLHDYDVFASLQDAVDKYPDAILANTVLNEVQFDEAIEKEIGRADVCYVIREKEI